MAEGFDKAEVVVGEVEVRPARADERRRWDALMAAHHYLGFRQFAGRGLRHVAVWRGHWLALVGWQSGAFKCAPRDRWLRWHRSVQFRRLHLIGNNTRFLVLPASAGVPNLASRTLGRSLRRLSADWAALHGHPLELAETFVDPSRFRGGCYDASNWVRVGRTKGFARHNGGYTDPHDCPKEMFVRPLRADARPRLADPADRPEWACRATPVRYTREELRSLRGLFAEVPDSRRGQGRKHRLATVLSVCALARLAGQYGPAATERFARNLDQEELRALGAWRSAEGRWVAPSDSTVCRVMADTDPDAPRDVLRRWAAPVGRAASRGGRGHAGAGRGRQADPGREPQRGRRLLRDRDAGHARRPPAREPLLPRPRRRDRGPARAARGRRPARLRGHPRPPALHPRHRARHRRDARRRLRAVDQDELSRHLLAARRHRLGPPRRAPPRRPARQGPRPHRGAPHRRPRPAAGNVRRLRRGPSGVPRHPRAHRREDRRDIRRDRLRHHLGDRRTRRPRTPARLEPRPLAGRERQPLPPRRHHGRGRQPHPRPATRPPTTPP